MIPGVKPKKELEFKLPSGGIPADAVVLANGRLIAFPEKDPDGNILRDSKGKIVRFCFLDTEKNELRKISKILRVVPMKGKDFAGSYVIVNQNLRIKEYKSNEDVAIKDTEDKSLGNMLTSVRGHGYETFEEETTSVAAIDGRLIVISGDPNTVSIKNVIKNRFYVKDLHTGKITTPVNPKTSGQAGLTASVEGHFTVYNLGTTSHPKNQIRFYEYVPPGRWFGDEKWKERGYDIADIWSDVVVEDDDTDKEEIFCDLALFTMAGKTILTIHKSPGTNGRYHCEVWIPGDKLVPHQKLGNLSLAVEKDFRNIKILANGWVALFVQVEKGKDVLRVYDPIENVYQDHANIPVGNILPWSETEVAICTGGNKISIYSLAELAPAVSRKHLIEETKTAETKSQPVPESSTLSASNPITAPYHGMTVETAKRILKNDSDIDYLKSMAVKSFADIKGAFSYKLFASLRYERLKDVEKKREKSKKITVLEDLDERLRKITTATDLEAFRVDLLKFATSSKSSSGFQSEVGNSLEELCKTAERPLKLLLPKRVKSAKKPEKLKPDTPPTSAVAGMDIDSSSIVPKPKEDEKHAQLQQQERDAATLASIHASRYAMLSAKDESELYKAYFKARKEEAKTSFSDPTIKVCIERALLHFSINNIQDYVILPPEEVRLIGSVLLDIDEKYRDKADLKKEEIDKLDEVTRSVRFSITGKTATALGQQEQQQRQKLGGQQP